jgi:type IV secretory pathway VirD2 relaxase
LSDDAATHLQSASRSKNGGQRGQSHDGRNLRGAREKHRFAHDAHVAHEFSDGKRSRVVRRRNDKSVGIVGNVGNSMSQPAK